MEAEETGPSAATSLADMVKRAQTFLASDDVPDTCSTLGAFVNEVKAQSGKSIPAAATATLIASAQRIGTLLGC